MRYVSYDPHAEERLVPYHHHDVCHYQYYDSGSGVGAALVGGVIGAALGLGLVALLLDKPGIKPYEINNPAIDSEKPPFDSLDARLE